jgi:hypothetical protein
MRMAVDTFVAYGGVYIEQAMQHADKLQSKELKADTAEIERDAEAAGADQAPAGN